jgi:hypothetical protein
LAKPSKRILNDVKGLPVKYRKNEEIEKCFENDSFDDDMASHDGHRIKEHKRRFVLQELNSSQLEQNGDANVAFVALSRRSR